MITTNINANNIVTRDIYKDYFSLQWQDNKLIRPYANIIYVNNKVAFCIEPGAPITAPTYSIDNNYLNEEQKSYIELISYYGYNKQNNSLFDYMITQEMIWEYLYGISVSWTNNPSTNEVIDLEYLRVRIENNIKNHNILPSFSNTTVKAYDKQTIELIDNNNVLNYYEISSNNKNDIKIEGNKLIINIIDSENETIKFTRKQNLVEDTVLYNEGPSQALAIIGLNKINQKPFEINIENLGQTLNFKKIGEVINYDNENYIEEVLLPNIDFKLYTDEFELIDIHTTNEEGRLIRISSLPIGNYHLIEVQSDQYIEIDPIYFTVDNENEIIIGDDNVVYNYLKKGNIKIIKKDMEERLIPNTKFGLYTESNKLLDTKFSDEHGEIIFTNIPYGKYYIQEIEAAFGYIKDEKKHYISITENEKTYELIIYNEIIRELPKTGVSENNILTKIKHKKFKIF